MMKVPALSKTLLPLEGPTDPQIVVPLTVKPEPKPAATDDPSVAALELVLDAGRRLRIGPGFDGPTLARLLALLEEGRP